MANEASPKNVLAILDAKRVSDRAQIEVAGLSMATAAVQPASRRRYEDCLTPKHQVANSLNTPFTAQTLRCPVASHRTASSPPGPKPRSRARLPLFDWPAKSTVTMRAVCVCPWQLDIVTLDDAKPVDEVAGVLYRNHRAGPALLVTVKNTP